MSKSEHHGRGLGLDQDGRLAVDLACVECRYNLRTLPGSGKCPECATPVWETIRRTVFNPRERRWLSVLATGAGLLVVALGSLALAVGLALLNRHFPRLDPSGEILLGLIPVLALLALLTLVVGVGTIGERDPNAGKTPSQTSARLRILLAVLPLLLLALGLGLGWLLAFTAEFIIIMILLAWAIPVVLSLALIRHVERLMKRLAEWKLARVLRAGSWAVALLAAVYLAAILAPLDLWQPNRFASPLYSVALHCTFLLLAAGVVVMAAVYTALRKRVRDAPKQADVT